MTPSKPTPPSEKRCEGSGQITVPRAQVYTCMCRAVPHPACKVHGVAAMDGPVKRPCQPSPDAPLIENNEHASPEADEQVGGERWTIYVCPKHGVRKPHFARYCGFPECGLRMDRIEVVPASSSIPTEKVRGVVEWMREKAKMARAERDNHADQGRIDYCDGQQHAWDQTADRLSALVEGIEDG